MEPTIFRSSEPDGKFSLNTKMTFGKYKGKSLTSIGKSLMISYLRWITHALTAEKFLVNLSDEAIRYALKTSKDSSVWIDGELRNYQMGKWYLDKIRDDTTLSQSNPTQRLLISQEELIRNSIHDINKLLQEL
jgi:hypothetical protein